MHGLDCARVGVRWTLGDVGPRGYEALRLSVWGAWGLFGPKAAYAVCVNTVPVAEARARTGDLPPGVAWRDCTADVPAWLLDHFEEGMAEGVGWKFAPVRQFPDRYELSLDNDCILWELPAAIGGWLADGDTERCVVAEDVVACFGQFARLCGEQGRNGGLRGFPPGFDFEAALRDTLRDCPVVMTSELDEQGLQAAAMSRHAPPRVVTLDEVTICSPFYPHIAEAGRCGAHFVGLNARHIPWDYYDRPADEWMTEHWARHRPALAERVMPGRSRMAAHAT